MSPLLTSSLVSFIVVLCGIPCKMLVRQHEPWKITDFCLGVELSLVALGITLTNLFHRALYSVPVEMSFIFSMLCVFSLLFILQIQRNIENPHLEKYRKRQKVYYVNLIGVFYLFLATYSTFW